MELIQRHDVESGSDLDFLESDLKLLMTKAIFIFEISVRLAMTSAKYNFPTKSPQEVLHSALNKLEEVVTGIKELVLFYRYLIEMTLSMASTQN